MMGALGSIARRTAWTLRAGRGIVILAALSGAAIATIQLLSLAAAMGSVGAEGSPTLGDTLAFVLKGANQPEPGSGRVSVASALLPPFGWIALVLVPSVVVALLPEERINELTLRSSRVVSWIGSCTALLVVLVLYWMAIILVCAVYVASRGGSMTFLASSWLPDAAGLARETLSSGPHRVGALVVGAVCVSCALGLAQKALSGLVGKLPAFGAVAALLSGSFLVLSPELLGNFMMAARSTAFMVSHSVPAFGGTLRAGLDPGQGILLAALLALVSVIAGAAVSARRDYLGSVRK